MSFLSFINIFLHLPFNKKQEKIFFGGGVQVKGKAGEETGSLPELRDSTKCQAHHIPNAVTK